MRSENGDGNYSREFSGPKDICFMNTAPEAGSKLVPIVYTLGLLFDPAKCWAAY
jgi:hypothetical protein